MSKILAIGSITKDIFFPTSEGIIKETPDDLLSQKKISFELGAKYHIENRRETLGGCPVNVACGLAKLGLDASCYVPIGDDEIGTWAKKQLSASGVDTGNFKILPGVFSDLSAIIVDSATGDRTIFSSHTASEKFEVEKEYLDAAEWIFIGDLSGCWKENLDAILEIVKEKNIPFAFNPRQKAIHDDILENIKAVALCKILFVNKDEAMEIVSLAAGDKQISDKMLNSEEYLAKTLKEMGAGIVAITDGIRGAWGYDGGNMLYAEALIKKAVDTTGAGDAFASGFLASYIKGKDLAACMKWAIANSSNSVTEYGGQKGLLDESQINAISEKVNITNLS